MLRHRRRVLYQQAMCSRLEHTYASATTDVSGLSPLCPPGPRGGVGVSDGGLVLGLAPSEQPPRLVPWQSIERVAPMRHGTFMLHISRVGDVMVPGSMGRQIWERMSERASSV